MDPYGNIPPPPEISVQFKVSILNATIFQATDMNGASDPYVKVFKITKKNEKKCKWTTQVCKNTLHPKFNEYDNISFTPRKKFLFLELWDKDILVDDLIGLATVEVDLDNMPQHHIAKVFKGDRHKANIEMNFEKKH
eukprot:gene4573-5703_t